MNKHERLKKISQRNSAQIFPISTSSTVFPVISEGSLGADTVVVTVEVVLQRRQNASYEVSNIFLNRSKIN